MVTKIRFEVKQERREMEDNGIILMKKANINIKLLSYLLVKVLPPARQIHPNGKLSRSMDTSSRISIFIFQSAQNRESR